MTRIGAISDMNPLNHLCRFAPNEKTYDLNIASTNHSSGERLLHDLRGSGGEEALSLFLLEHVFRPFSSGTIKSKRWFPELAE